MTSKRSTPLNPVRSSGSGPGGRDELRKEVREDLSKHADKAKKETHDRLQKQEDQRSNNRGRDGGGRNR